MSESVPPENWSRYLLAASGILVVFGIWLSLFTLGILVDTEPYRRVISERGVFDLETDALQSDGDSLVRGVARRDTVFLQVPPGVSTFRDTSTEDTASYVVGVERSPPLSDSATPGVFRSDGFSSPDTAGSPPPMTRPSGPTHSTVWAFLVVLFCFTPSNLALLCCSAGMLGAMGRRVVLSTPRNQDAIDSSYPLLSAILRGFFVYLSVISGLLVLLENPILGTVSPGQYIRFAGLLSLMSFFVNYDPSLFAALLDRVRDRMEETTGRPAPSEESPSSNDQ